VRACRDCEQNGGENTEHEQARGMPKGLCGNRGMLRMSWHHAPYDATVTAMPVHS
jgi:hypothetical protein